VSQEAKTRVIVADSDPRVRSALRILLLEEPGLALVGETSDLPGLVTQVRQLKPDLVLLDWELPGRPAAAMLRSIGADHVIDYTQEDFTQNEQRYDLIFDVVANRSVSEYMRALSPKGNYVAVPFSAGALFLGPLISMIGSKKVGQFSHKPNQEDLVFMKELIEAGKVKSVIDRRYPLSEVPEALRYYGEGHARGKVVITVVPSDKT